MEGFLNAMTNVKTVRLNSIGDPSCRPQYVARLNEWLDAHPELVDEEIAHNPRARSARLRAARRLG